MRYQFLVLVIRHLSGRFPDDRWSLGSPLTVVIPRLGIRIYIYIYIYYGREIPVLGISSVIPPTGVHSPMTNDHLDSHLPG